MLLLLTTTRFAVSLLTVATADTPTLFVTGNSVARSKLDFQLDDFIPLFVAPIALGN